MDALFFIELPKNGNIDVTTKVNWYKKNNEDISSGTDELNTLKDNIEKCQCIAVFPGSNAYLTHSELSISNHKQLEQALSYDLEEQLAEDVEKLHFAYQKNAQKKLDIAIINTALLTNWLAVFSEAGIQLTHVLADTHLLSNFSEPWLLLHDNDYTLLKSYDESYALETDNLNDILEIYSADLPVEVKLYSSTILSIESSPVNLLAENYYPSIFNLLCQHYDPRLINILQGQFQSKTKKTWRLIQVVFAGLFSVLIALTIMQNIQKSQLQEQESQLEQNITSIYKASFPKSKRIINPVSQMRTGLKSLQKNKTLQGGFTPLLAGVARALRTQKNINLIGIQYAQSKLNIEFSTPSLAQLEVFKNALSQQNLNAEIASATKADNRVLAKLKITGGK